MIKKEVRIFTCFEDENSYETQRQSSMTSEERFIEFSLLQSRIWGHDKLQERFVKKVVINTHFLQ
jgi:hypothetical protein